MKKSDVVQIILGEKIKNPPSSQAVQAFAPTNIALCKYWGKRNRELNLPVTSSLSISLGNRGATVTLQVNQRQQDIITLNGAAVHEGSIFYQRAKEFLDLFRQGHYFDLHSTSNIPIAAGLASSACGFAAIVLALDKLFAWELSSPQLSILARLGSGSASRSIYQGFVKWHAGIEPNGMDSYAETLPHDLPGLMIGLCIVNDKEKMLSSREAMQRTVETSLLYRVWPEKMAEDLILMTQAIANQDFSLLGVTAESNALAMHATMQSAWPPIVYSLPETLAMMHEVWQLRAGGVEVYFTQDAGPNLKLLFLEKDVNVLQERFPNMEIIAQ